MDWRDKVLVMAASAGAGPIARAKGSDGECRELDPGRASRGVARVQRLLLTPLWWREGGGGIGFDDTPTLLLLPRPVLNLLDGVDVLGLALRFTQMLKGWQFLWDSFDQRLLSRSKWVMQRVLLSEARFKVPPHEPEEASSARFRGERGACDEIEEVELQGEMKLRQSRSILIQDEDEVDWIGAWHAQRPEALDRGWFLLVLTRSLENRLQPRRILELLRRIRVLMSLETRYGVISAELGTHFGEDWTG